jgi:hypothetical protein
MAGELQKSACPAKKPLCPPGKRAARDAKWAARFGKCAAGGLNTLGTAAVKGELKMTEAKNCLTFDSPRLVLIRGFGEDVVVIHFSHEPANALRSDAGGHSVGLV